MYLYNEDKDRRRRRDALLMVRTDAVHTGCHKKRHDGTEHRIISPGAIEQIYHDKHAI